MNRENHIIASADTCSGKPRIKGTRITVELVLNNLAAGSTETQIIEAYPHITAEQIRAAVAFASSRVAGESTLAGVEAAA